MRSLAIVAVLCVSCPLVFGYKERDLVAGRLAGTRLALHDNTSFGGEHYNTSLYQTGPIVKNEGGGAWGHLATFEDKDGSRWIFVSVQGPLASEIRFPTTNVVIPNGSIAAFKVDKKAVRQC